MNLDEKTVGEAFEAAGYATGAFGKWHNGMQYPYHPNGRGFGEYYGFCSGHWGHYFEPMLEHNGRIVKGKGFIIDDLTDQAMAFMKRSVRSRQPFFAYLPYNTPHSPMQVPERFWKKFDGAELEMLRRDGKKEEDDFTRAALAMCENIDWNVGRVLKLLQDLKLEEDTIVLYFSDNGPNGWRWNGGMRGKKGSTDEGGVRSPLAVRWPGHIAAGKRISEIAGVIDLLPTLTALVGIADVSEKPLDGVSLKPLLLESNPEWEDRMIFSQWSKRVSVRTQQFRLDHTGKLYDMGKDPAQEKDVAEARPEVAKRLRKAVEDWREDVLEGYDDDERPFVIGHPGCMWTQIPARDAVAHGEIKRSNRWPNCSFYTNWVNKEDYISLAAELPASGVFDVQVYYTCPKEDIGSTVEMSFNGGAVRGVVAEAHDPPLVGAAQDRSERMESYVKDFKVLRLGKVQLAEGQGELALRALDMPGGQVMDFRLMMLERVG
jgi:arylsulfatase A-like enzyme